MPESRGRSRKPTRQILNKPARRTPATKEGTGTNIPSPAPTRQRILDIWKDVWAILGPAIALITFDFFLWPTVTIDASVEFNPSDPLSTQFRMKNTGHVPIYDVYFKCAIGDGEMGLAFMNRETTLRPADVLMPGVAITRSCVLSSFGANIQNIEILSEYKWPIFGIRDIASAYFRVVLGKNGATYLVPDVPPGQTPNSGPPVARTILR